MIALRVIDFGYKYILLVVFGVPWIRFAFIVLEGERASPGLGYCQILAVLEKERPMIGAFVVCGPLNGYI